ncbi:tRNA (adenosine(37)-N6)-threonylcarbamoyltransferase complex ATPase subunit type 1 TsaE [Caenispirillum bisanense]|uniref:tRNA (adenosine(37)-N6)-threonylcarbamoyltransferase complex ATPase subunit type 1 TsaE n=1 Tax=Caenispirillum bisanense TaxID=414052 RepID=UPI0031DA6BA6
MSQPDPAAAAVSLILPDEAATARLAQALAAVARAGDVIALRGDLGAGKTAFARAFVRARLGDPAAEVPSPTFTLVQTYDDDACDAGMWHFDLYRLERPEDALELDLEDAFADGLCLIEWPDRLGGYLPRRRLDLTLTIRPEGAARDAVLTGPAHLVEAARHA